MEGDHDDDSAYLEWRRAEATRRWQQHRTLAIAIGEMYLSLARAHVRHLHDTRKACGLLVKSCERFGAAGLTRRARVVFRYCRIVHSAPWRSAR